MALKAYDSSVSEIYEGLYEIYTFSGNGQFTSSSGYTDGHTLVQDGWDNIFGVEIRPTKIVTIESIVSF